MMWWTHEGDGLQQKSSGPPIGQQEQGWSEGRCDALQNQGSGFSAGPLSDSGPKPIADQRHHHNETSPECDDQDMVILDYVGVRLPLLGAYA